MSATLNDLVREAQATGTLKGLPDRHFIDGGFVPAVHGGRMQTADPGTARAFAEFAAGDAADIDAAVDAAQTALRGPWRALRPSERGRVLQRARQCERCRRLRAAPWALSSGKRRQEFRSRDVQ